MSKEWPDEGWLIVGCQGCFSTCLANLEDKMSLGEAYHTIRKKCPRTRDECVTYPWKIVDNKRQETLLR